MVNCIQHGLTNKDKRICRKTTRQKEKTQKHKMQRDL